MKNTIRKLSLLGIGLFVLNTGTMYSADIANISREAELNKFLHDNQLVLIEYYHPTCPVCNAFKSKGIFPETANQLPYIKFAMVSAEEGKRLHKLAHIEQYPTFIYYKDGNEFTRKVGYVDNPVFANRVRQTFSTATKEKPNRTYKL